MFHKIGGHMSLPSHPNPMDGWGEETEGPLGRRSASAQVKETVCVVHIQYHAWLPAIPVSKMLLVRGMGLVLDELAVPCLNSPTQSRLNADLKGTINRLVGWIIWFGYKGRMWRHLLWFLECKPCTPPPTTSLPPTAPLFLWAKSIRLLVWPLTCPVLLSPVIWICHLFSIRLPWLTQLALPRLSGSLSLWLSLSLSLSFSPLTHPWPPLNCFNFLSSFEHTVPCARVCLIDCLPVMWW